MAFLFLGRLLFLEKCFLGRFMFPPRPVFFVPVTGAKRSRKGHPVWNAVFASLGLSFSPGSLLLASSSGRLPRGEVVSTETPGFDLPWR